MDWQPIETAPKDGTEVILYVADFDSVTTGWYSSRTGLWPRHDEFTEDGDACNIGLPTHWMPLPEPPK